MAKTTAGRYWDFQLTSLTVDPLQFKPRMPTLAPKGELYVSVYIPASYWADMEKGVLTLKGYNYLLNTIYQELNNINTK